MTGIIKWLNKHNAFFADIPLFYKDGYAYFEKVMNESSFLNCKRLLFYIALSLLISFYLTTENATDTSALVSYSKIWLGNLSRWLLWGAVAYYFSLFSIPTDHKLKLILNYLIFQCAITGTVLIIIWVLFINLEEYTFYYLYVLAGIGIPLYFLRYFFQLFFHSATQKLCGIAIFFSIITVGTFLFSAINLLDIKHALLYDPILPEVSTASDISNDLSFTEKQVIRFQLLNESFA